jgi:hypothetical protein
MACGHQHRRCRIAGDRCRLIANIPRVDTSAPQTTLSSLLVRIWCGAVMDHKDDIAFDPISIARCREILGDEAEGLTEMEVDQICRHAESMAHVIVDLYLEKSISEE